MIKNNISFGLNDELITISLSKGSMTLARFLREEHRLTGTKIVCAEGDCGACSVLIDRKGRGNYQVVNSCILPLMVVQGTHIVTIEGFSKHFPSHPMKIALQETLGSQCGFCTPGFMMSLGKLQDEWVNQKKTVEAHDVQMACSGHLCRCTGYKAILDGALQAMENKSPGGRIHEKFSSIREKVFTGEPKANYLYVNKQKMFAIPRGINQACFWKSRYNDLVLLSGATDLAVVANKLEQPNQKWMSLKNITLLSRIDKDDDGRWIIGANVTLAKVASALKSTHKEFSNFLNYFASPNIRNSGTLVGNIVNASPIGDCLPYLYIVHATIQLISSRGSRTLPIEEFIIGYRKTVLRSDEIVKSITIPPLSDKAFIFLRKVSKREFMDISLLSIAMRVELEEDTVKSMACAYGGMAAEVRRLRNLEQSWQGKSLSEIRGLSSSLRDWFQPISDHRGSAEYRLQVAENLLKQGFAELEKTL